ncbi:MAG: hypothetical protein KAJ10_09015 [Thermodesulfovibrionia bacterium]|nr:hypothetical protein [Thermodesulfovibrionia bacterium]
MKSVIFLLAVLVCVVGNANGSEIHATMTEADGNTMITCVPNGYGEVEKAYISLYVSDGQELFISRQEMEVSYENVATYELSGTHAVLEGKCKFIFARGNLRILREDFLVSMK